MTTPGEPAELERDCIDALQRLVFFVDQELADADAEQIRQHIDECAPCLRAYDVERIVKALVARSCSDRAPEELRRRVMVRIHEVRVTYEQG